MISLNKENWQNHVLLHSWILNLLSQSYAGSWMQPKCTPQGRDVGQWIDCQTGTPLRQVCFPGAAREFSPRINFQCRLSYNVLVCKSHSYTSVRTLNVAGIGYHTFVWTDENNAHTVGNG